MTFVEIIETSGGRRNRRYYLAVLAMVYIGVGMFTAARFAGWPFETWRSRIVDFNDFYLAGALVGAGRVDSAYSLIDLLGLQRLQFGDTSPMPWTYPPQFDLLLGLLARLPIGAAYGLFISATLGAYALTIRRLAPGQLVSVLMLLAPAIVVTVRCGQNGFLTGALIGMSAIGLMERRAWAGVPLGLMIIKPHLAVAFALHALLSKRWNVALMAGLVVVLTSALATAVLGFGVWRAFEHGVREAGGFLASGLYPHYRMVSGYALARSLGASAAVGTAVQLTFAAGAIVATALAVTRFSERQAIGIAAIASVMISPYAYDYDLPVFGIGVAMLLKDLTRYGTQRERFALYVVVLGVQITAFALAVKADFAVSADQMPVSLGCFAVTATLAMVWRILERSRADSRAPASLLAAGAPAM
jgi:hypothetical protein